MFKNYRTDRCYIISEIGGNFTTFDQAKKLIDESLLAGVDAIKLQTYSAETISSKNAIFNMENTGVVSQYELFKKYEIDEQLHREVFEYAIKNNLDCFSTPSHESDVEMLEKLNVGLYKIGSDDATNIPFLKYVAKIGKPIMLSTGMCTLNEVNKAVDAIFSEGNANVKLLHAITSYPTHYPDVNLKSIETLKLHFPQLDIGYSDHTLTPIACLCAVAMGARIIEKHFTYDKKAEGPDHMLSADPAEMKWIVDSIRAFELMRGTGIKMPAKSEKNTRINNRKSLVLGKDVTKGYVLKSEDIKIKRPGYGIQPECYELALGRRVQRDMQEDEVIDWKDLS
jgi:sialic acid synthase SpsE